MLSKRETKSAQDASPNQEKPNELTQVAKEFPELAPAIEQLKKETDRWHRVCEEVIEKKDKLDFCTPPSQELDRMTREAIDKGTLDILKKRLESKLAQERLEVRMLNEVSKLLDRISQANSPEATCEEIELYIKFVSMWLTFDTQVRKKKNSDLDRRIAATLN